ncbi:L,D-transpeptidase [Lapidilactobacillus wuchangensis]|uniref:L,D-transpeptidase n=1 Tax=Lapidilactobacillus wuchangensis TaxID=2486001 RepID=UPI000F779D26|nr:L,D-transpeptidase [Lapidilactobacillus wuchangensis]
MEKPTRNYVLLTILFGCLLLGFVVYRGLKPQAPQNLVLAKTQSQRAKQEKAAATSKKASTADVSSKSPKNFTKSSSAQTSKKTMPVDWQGPSETKPYPTLQPTDWIKVSLKNQRTYLMRDQTVLYTMRCSTGSGGDRATPAGNFAIQSERGEQFFNQQSGEGARYWVSWKDHGIYLFHSVPIDHEGNYIVSEAEQLGKVANSHGCIRLSVADAQWLYKSAITGMKVVVA